MEKILIAPLNWGLGHATRMVPIIQEELNRGNKVIIGSNGMALKYLCHRFPNLECLRIPFPKICYSKKLNMPMQMGLLAPLLLWGIFREHFLLSRIIKKHNITCIISDNRFGLYSRKVRSVFVTHQLWIRTSERSKIVENIINFINHYFIRKFDECWVPDFANGKNLAGELSHIENLNFPIKYIGPLSRFSVLNDIPIKKTEYDILGIISGPEPYRSEFEIFVKDYIKTEGKKGVIVKGKPDKNIFVEETENWIEYNHLPDDALACYIKNVPTIISRSGYSTIMDLHCIGKKARLIATPGQTEQEYLAELHSIS